MIWLFRRSQVKAGIFPLVFVKRFKISLRYPVNQVIVWINSSLVRF